MVFIRFFSVWAAHCEKFTAIIDIYWECVRKFTMVFRGIKSFFSSQLRVKALGGKFIAKYLTDKPSRNLCANALY